MIGGDVDGVSEPRVPLAEGFPSTKWTMVIEAACEDGDRAARALGELYLRYRRPLLGLLRKKGVASADCEDVLQGFFARLISKAGMARVKRSEGRFRSFLRLALERFAIDVWRKDGSKPVVSLDAGDLTSGKPWDFPDTDPQPDQEFDHGWAVAVLRCAMERLEAEYAQRGRGQTFDVLDVFLAEKKPGLQLREAARQLGVSEGAVKTEVCRLRARYRDLIDAEIADTLRRPTRQAVEDEKRALFAVLSRS